jgi:hypothetical protein
MSKNLYLINFSSRVKNDLLAFFTNYQNKFHVSALSYIEREKGQNTLYVSSTSTDFDSFKYVLTQQYGGDFEAHFAATSAECSDKERHH